MKQLKFIVPALLLLTLFAGVADAQKKTSKKTSVKKPAGVKTVPPLDVRTARERIENQLANVTMFVDLLGPVAQQIETHDASAKKKRLSKKDFDQNEANKQKVVVAIRNLKAGLTDLETEFRTRSTLKKYLSNIEGITELAAESEDMAIAGNFLASKDPLRTTAQKLTDTLAILPK